MADRVVLVQFHGQRLARREAQPELGHRLRGVDDGRVGQRRGILDGRRWSRAAERLALTDKLLRAGAAARRCRPIALCKASRDGAWGPQGQGIGRASATPKRTRRFGLRRDGGTSSLAR